MAIRRYGSAFSSVRPASRDARRFKMYRQHLSRKYTTDISEVLGVNFFDAGICSIPSFVGILQSSILNHVLVKIVFNQF